MKNYVYYSNLVIQMIAIILLFSLGGKYLDKKVNYSIPYFTIIGSLLGVLLSMIYVIRQILNKKNEK